jgi:hypothetical protein
MFVYTIKSFVRGQGIFAKKTESFQKNNNGELMDIDYDA